MEARVSLLCGAGNAFATNALSLAASVFTILFEKRSFGLQPAVRASASAGVELATGSGEVARLQDTRCPCALGVRGGSPYVCLSLSARIHPRSPLVLNTPVRLALTTESNSDTKRKRLT